MRICSTILIILLLTALFSGCYVSTDSVDVVATTKPVYELSMFLCQNTDLSVGLLISENVSCLHDYSLQVKQMRMLENANLVILSGAGLEATFDDVIHHASNIIDSSAGIPLLCGEHNHTENSEHSHNHDNDPHTWLSIGNARFMAANIYSGLCLQYPQYVQIFSNNLELLNAEFDDLELYAHQQLSSISCREIITFHDGFSYFAQFLDLTIIKAIEEEAGSEASAEELIEIIELVQDNRLPAIFVEESGSSSAAQIIARETGVKIYALDMGMSERGYFEAMYHNIDTIKEALE